MRFLENFDQNKKIYETISTKVEIFENSEQNQDFTLISTKIEIFENFDQNRDFRIFRLKSRFS